jgi:ubiquinone/menaquinone biosynthesis C-methylase UbiE
MFTEEEERIRAFFDQRADIFDSFAPDEEERIGECLREWGIRPGMRVLEPGCGSGRLTVRLAEATGPDGEVWAFDLSGAMIERARGRGLPAHVRFTQTSANDIPCGADRFDRVICFNAFPHFTDRKRAVAEMARVLKPGGLLFIRHLRSRDDLNTFHRNAAPELADHQIPPDDEMCELLLGAGLGGVVISGGNAPYSVRAEKRPV